MECFCSTFSELPSTQAGGSLDSLAEVGGEAEEALNSEDEEVEDSGECRDNPIIISPNNHSSTLNCLLHLSNLRPLLWPTNMLQGSSTPSLEDLLMESLMML